MKEEERSKARATKVVINHVDLVQAQDDKHDMAIIKKMMQKGRADAV